MNKVDLGLIRGNMWYAGKTISGNSSAPRIFTESGIEKAYANDLYINTDTGNIYQCVEPGDSYEASWTYIGCIKGPQPGIVNNLTSTSTTLALSGKMGKKLNDKINNAGLYPFTVIPNATQPTYLLRMEIEDKDTTITITDEDGNVGAYEVQTLGINEKQTVTIPINNTIGFPQFGAVIKTIHSDNSTIYSYIQYDENTQEIANTELNLWQAILDQTVDRKGAFVEEDKLYYTAQITKVIDNVVKELYPVTHDLAIWHNKNKNILLHDKILDIDQAIENAMADLKALEGRVDITEVDIDTLELELTQIQEFIKGLENMINSLAGKVIDDYEALQEVTDEGYITGALAAQGMREDIFNNLTVKYNPLTDYVEVHFNGEVKQVLKAGFVGWKVYENGVLSPEAHIESYTSYGLFDNDGTHLNFKNTGNPRQSPICYFAFPFNPKLYDHIEATYTCNSKDVSSYTRVGIGVGNSPTNVITRFPGAYEVDSVLSLEAVKEYDTAYLIFMSAINYHPDHDPDPSWGRIYLHVSRLNFV